MATGRRLVWSEEFDGSELSQQIWNMDIGDGASHGLIGWGNNELQFYTAQSITTDGQLIITAEREPENSALHCYYGPAQWTSGKIRTSQKVGFKYGALEVKARMPFGKGTWPAIWMLGASINDGVNWPLCGEIDLQEGVGSAPQTVRGTIHGPLYFGEAGLTQTHENPTLLSEEFHIYGINWSEDQIEWTFDGTTYNTIRRDDAALEGKEWPFNNEFYLLINQAIGGWFGGEVDPELKRAELTVDWVRFYSVDGIGEVILH
ncbi:MAG: glycoside hydrolase family 16 protein [Actinomycetes bacterium]